MYCPVFILLWCFLKNKGVPLYQAWSFHFDVGQEMRMGVVLLLVVRVLIFLQGWTLCVPLQLLSVLFETTKCYRIFYYSPCLTALLYWVHFYRKHGTNLTQRSFSRSTFIVYFRMALGLPIEAMCAEFPEMLTLWCPYFSHVHWCWILLLASWYRVKHFYLPLRCMVK